MFSWFLIPASNCRGLSCSTFVLTLIVLAQSSFAQSQPIVQRSLLATEPLLEIENRVMPAPLVEGTPQHQGLAEYYLAENRELAFRLQHVAKFTTAESRDLFRW